MTATTATAITLTLELPIVLSGVTTVACSTLLVAGTFVEGMDGVKDGNVGVLVPGAAVGRVVTSFVGVE